MSIVNPNFIVIISLSVHTLSVYVINKINIIQRLYSPINYRTIFLCLVSVFCLKATIEILSFGWETIMIPDHNSATVEYMILALDAYRDDP